MAVTPTGRVAVVIEDDPDVRDLIRTILTQSGFDTVTAPDGPAGIEAVRTHQPILTTLDVSMPGMDGFAVATRLREFSSTYIVMLTGQSDEIDVIQGLQSGADDYLVKPFRPRELRSRIEAMLRRPQHYTAAPSAASGSVVAERAAPSTPQPAEVGASEPVPPPIRDGAAPMTPTVPLPVPPATTPVPVAEPAPVVHAPRHAAPVPPVPATPDPVQHDGIRAGHEAHGAVSGESEWLEWHGLAANPGTRIATADGRAVDLTRSEFDLLVAMLRTGRRVRSKADLVLALRGENYVTTYYVTDADKRGIEVHMANLRRKIGDSSATPRWVETVRGVGYRRAVD